MPVPPDALPLLPPDDADPVDVDGVPVLVPRAARFLARHGVAWAPGDGVAAREWLPIDAPDPLTPFLPPRALAEPEWGAPAPLADALRSLGDRSPVSVCAAWGDDFAPDGPALDLGCGVGAMALRMAATRPTAAVDRSPGAVLLARALLLGRLPTVRVPAGRWGARDVAWPFDAVPEDRVTFAIADATSPPFPPETFAWIHAGNLLDLLEDAADAVLVEMVDRLLPFGVVTLSTPHDLEPDPSAPAPEDVLRARLDAAGLSIVDEDRDVPWVIREYDRGWRWLTADCLIARRAPRRTRGSTET